MSHLEERKKPIVDYLSRDTASTTELSYLSGKTIASYTKGYTFPNQPSTPIPRTASPNPEWRRIRSSTAGTPWPRRG
jgi:hypothetical protein